MSKIASTRRLVVPTCNNCGKKMELGQGKTKDGLLYLFWWCLGSLQDDACERNEDVLSEITI